MIALNKNLKRLYTIAGKSERIAIGLMSGTSLDGLDIALCKFKGKGVDTQIELLQFRTSTYTEQFKEEIRFVFSRKQVDLEKLCLLNALIANVHAELVLQSLKQWNVNASAVDFIASHGQTIYHAPKRFHGQANFPNATLQIGDGDHLAVKTGILTISDFRQKHVAAGGEGAPLALYGDILLAAKSGENRLLLNIGGIANFTFLPGNDDWSAVVCTDVGPGNTLVDAACKKYFDLPFDEDGKIAFSGKVNGSLLSALAQHEFFKATLPKTTGPELFNLDFVGAAQQKSKTENLSMADLVATISFFTVQMIANVIQRKYADLDLKIFVSGGGARNLFLMQNLKRLLPGTTIMDSSVLGIDPDAKEAILFALLGNEALVGNPLAIGSNPSVLMGKFSFPG